MRKLFAAFLMVALIFGSITSTHASAIPEEGLLDIDLHFKDAPEFASWVRENLDTDGDGYLSDEEREAVTEIDVSGQKIYILGGIEIFPNLETLKCSGCEIGRLNLRSESLKYLDCSENYDLNELDLTQCYYLEEVNCSSLSLHNELDVCGLNILE